MKRIKTSAPGKVILFGEHAVVYDKLGIAASVDKRSLVKVISAQEKISILSKNFNLEKSLSEDELLQLFELIQSLKKDKNFDEIKELGKKDRLLPSFFVISHLVKRYGFKPFRVEIDSEVPKNLGSSSSVFSSLALAVSRFLGKELSKEEISRLAYEGDIIAHGGTPSGIDNSIVTYGGYLQYRKSEGVKRLKINFQLPLIFVDSGEPARTGETVSYVRKQREENEKFVNKILNTLNEISFKSLDALKNQDLESFGKLMFNYYSELRKLNISTERLDKIVKIALESKALGVKPTGGWGGGCCIVLAENQKQANGLIKIFKKNGFNSFQTKIGVKGVREII